MSQSFGSHLSQEDNIFENGSSPMPAAGLASHAQGLFNAIVSHTTEKPENITSILWEGIKCESHPDNLYGGKAFYVAQKGYSIQEASGEHSVVFTLSRDAKIFDLTHPANREQALWSAEKVTSYARAKGFDAIRYEGSIRLDDGSYNYNLAILKNPEKLTPIGVYGGESSAGISIPAIRTFQALGAAGTAFSLYHAGTEIYNSSHPIKETFHQAGLFGVAMAAGAKAAKHSLQPCAKVGARFPTLAPFIIPGCVAASSLAASTAAMLGVDLFNYFDPITSLDSQDSVLPGRKKYNYYDVLHARNHDSSYTSPFFRTMPETATLGSKPSPIANMQRAVQNTHAKTNEVITDFTNITKTQLNKSSNIFFEWVNQHRDSWSPAPSLRQKEFDTHIQKVVRENNLNETEGAIYAFQAQQQLAEYFDNTGQLHAGKSCPGITNTNITPVELQTELNSFLAMAKDRFPNDASVLLQQVKAESDSLKEFIHSETFRAQAKSVGLNVASSLSIEKQKELEGWMEGMQTVSLIGPQLAALGQLFHAPDLVRLGTACSGMANITYGIGNILQTGVSLNSVGMVLSGLNLFMSCFSDEEEESNNGLNQAFTAIFENLKMISSQIYDLHRDMIDHFTQMFILLRSIRADLIQGFADTRADIQQLRQLINEIKAQNYQIQSSLSGIGEQVKSVGAAVQLLREETQYQSLRKSLAEAVRELGFVNKERHDSHFKKILGDFSDLLGTLQKSASPGTLGFHLDKNNVGPAFPILLEQLKSSGLLTSVNPDFLDPHTWLTTSSVLLNLVTQYQLESGAAYRVSDRFHRDFETMSRSGQLYLDFAYQLYKENSLFHLLQEYQKILGAIIQEVQNKIQHFEEYTFVEEGEKRVHIAAKQAAGQRQFLSKTCFVEPGKKTENYQIALVNQSLPAAQNVLVGAWKTTYPELPWWYSMVGNMVYMRFSGALAAHNLSSFDSASCSQYNAAQKQRISQSIQDFLAQWPEVETNATAKILLFNSILTQQTDGDWELNWMTFPSSALILSHVFVYEEDMGRDPSSYTYPVLPLPGQTPVLDPVFAELEKSGYGKVVYCYKITKNPAQLLLSALFQYYPFGKNETISLWSYPVNFSPPFGRFDSDAIWNAWMGGSYARETQKVDLSSTYSPPCTQPIASWRSLPLLANHTALRAQIIPALAALSTSPQAVEKAREILAQFIMKQRKEIHQHVQSLFESQNMRTSSLAKQLQILDHHTQLIRAVLAIVYRKELLASSSISNALGISLVDSHKIIGFLATYSPSQASYLHHLLAEYYNITANWLQQLALISNTPDEATIFTEVLKQQWCGNNYPEMVSMLREWEELIDHTRTCIVPERTYEYTEKFDLKIGTAAEQAGIDFVCQFARTVLQTNGFSQSDIDNWIEKPTQNIVIEPRDITTQIAKGLSSGALRKIDGLIENLEEKFEATSGSTTNVENEKRSLKMLKELKKRLRETGDQIHRDVIQSGGLLQDSTETLSQILGSSSIPPTSPAESASSSSAHFAAPRSVPLEREWRSQFFQIPQTKGRNLSSTNAAASNLGDLFARPTAAPV